MDTAVISIPRNAAVFELIKPYAQNPAVGLKISHALINALGNRPIIAGDTMMILYDSSGIHTLEYKLKPWKVISVSDSNGNIVVKELERPLHKGLAFISGKIQSSLYESMLTLGLPAKVSVNFAEIFAWDIDFFVETTSEDSFYLLVEKYSYGNRYTEYGRILWAEYSGKRTGKLEAFYFNGSYYLPDGRPIKRQFLRSPLTYRRITSYFTNRRFHPILRVYRPHHGIDYAAPYGTPVSSVADGIVIYAGWKGGYGKFVQIRHANGYVSGYGHLSRIKRGIHRGKRVKQGEVIGYVGSTGLSTGPHLHFEIKFNGRYVNPLRIKPPRAKPLPVYWKPYFEFQKNSIRGFVFSMMKNNRSTAMNDGSLN